MWEDTVEHISNADPPLSFPQWFLFFIAHSPTSGNEDCSIRQDGVYPTLFIGCQGPLSFQRFGQELTSGL